MIDTELDGLVLIEPEVHGDLASCRATFPASRESGGSVPNEIEEHRVALGNNRIFVQSRPGDGPPIVLLHGFPDNTHLYDRLAPRLSPPRRVVAFDFMGYGRSDKPADYPYGADQQVEELNVVVDGLGLERVVLVCHDMSGPPTIDWALSHRDRVAGLVLLNTYYGEMPSLGVPKAIRLFSTPGLRSIARLPMRSRRLFRLAYDRQVSRFFREPAVRDESLPVIRDRFMAGSGSFRAFFALNEDLWPTVRDRTEKLYLLRQFDRPVRIIFGDQDTQLNVGVAERFNELFPDSELFLIPGGHHFVQMDEPERVAELISSMPIADAETD